MSSAAVAGSPPRPGADVVMPVVGMTCAACAARVEKKLNGIDGVPATVNLSTTRASVTVDGGPAQQEEAAACRG